MEESRNRVQVPSVQWLGCLTPITNLALDKVTAFPNLRAFQQRLSFGDEIDSLNLRCLAAGVYRRLQAQWSAKHE